MPSVGCGFPTQAPLNDAKACAEQLSQLVNWSLCNFCLLADRFLPARLTKNTNIDMAEQNGSALRRPLTSAECFNDCAIRFGSPGESPDRGLERRFRV